MSEFKTPIECTDARDFRAWSRPYGTRDNAKGETRQVQCAKCMRWCYKASRCNLFEGLPQRRSRIRAALTVCEQQ